jgi:hypothetical protein
MSFPALHAAAVEALGSPHQLPLLSGVAARRHGRDGVAIEGAVDLARLPGSAAASSAELRRLLHLCQARWGPGRCGVPGAASLAASRPATPTPAPQPLRSCSACSHQELLELLEEQYSEVALLDTPSATVLEIHNVAAWRSAQKAGMLARKVGGRRGLISSGSSCRSQIGLSMHRGASVGGTGVISRPF